MTANFYTVKGYALGRGIRVFRIDRAECVSREDYEVIRRDLPRAIKSMRRMAASA